MEGHTFDSTYLGGRGSFWGKKAWEQKAGKIQQELVLFFAPCTVSQRQTPSSEECFSCPRFMDLRVSVSPFFLLY